MAVSRLLAAGLAFAVTAAVTPLVMRVARRVGVMDHPGPLKPHAAPVPYLGGVAVFLGAAVALAFSPEPAILLPLLGALVLGVVDDVTSLPVLPRFLAEVAIGVAVAWSVGLDLSVLSAVVVVGTVALINAVNFVDGIDALAAGVTAVSFVGFALVLPPDWRVGAGALAGAAVGFLLYNRPSARIYLGDAGSYLLGTALAAMAAAMVLHPPDAGAAAGGGGFLGHPIDVRDVLLLVPLVGYPFLEAVSTVARRLVGRRPLFAGDRDHVYDQLMQRGQTGPVTAATIIGAQVLVVAVAVGLHNSGSAVPALVLAAVVLAATSAAAIPRSTPAS